MKADDVVLTVTEDDDPALRAGVGAVLTRHNEEKMGSLDRRALSIIIRDPETQEIIGGLIGRTTLGLLFIDLLALSPQLRGGGLGSRLLQMAEEEGRKRGCRAATLYTTSFQAPDFYKRCGYHAFGEIDGDRGVKRIFMVKELA